MVATCFANSNDDSKASLALCSADRTRMEGDSSAVTEQGRFGAVAAEGNHDVAQTSFGDLAVDITNAFVGECDFETLYKTQQRALARLELSNQEIEHFNSESVLELENVLQLRAEKLKVVGQLQRSMFRTSQRIAALNHRVEMAMRDVDETVEFDATGSSFD